MKILGLYFSGTGNTKWVSHTLENKLSKSGYDVKMYSVEDKSAKDIAVLWIGFNPVKRIWSKLKGILFISVIFYIKMIITLTMGT